MSELINNRWEIDKELEITKEWKKKNEFEFDKNTKKEIFSIDTPPPYINAPIHIGHATVYTLMDMFARYKRMNNYEVLFPLGLDRNGLPIEVSAEKKYNVKLTDLDRETAIKYCREVLNDTSNESIDSFSKLGISFSSYDIGDKIGEGYFTDSDDFRALTQSTFIELFKRGLIYEDERINNWDPILKTTIADSEIEYLEKESNFCEVKFRCKETNEDLIIGTTRPELIGSCEMVIYNPQDERYKHLEGKTAILPIYNREVKIMSHPHAKIDKGTGLVMMASAGDVYDIQFFREQNLTPRIMIDMDGKMNEKAGVLSGLYVKKARARMIELLEENNMLVGTKKIMHRVPISERSKAEIEFIEMKEYYLKQVEFIQNLKDASEKFDFYSKDSKKILDSWLDSVSIDWPISRRRYYGTEIPVWKCLDCGEINVPKIGKYYVPWAQDCPIDKCSKCSSKNLIGEEKIFDTWFDSGSTNLHILGYLKDKDFFNKNSICTLRPQGKEIIRTWLYYTLVKNYLINQKAPFRDVWIHHHVVDENGFKMSKSKGNGIDPNEILKKYGTESFRLWIVLEGNIDSSDLRCSFDRIQGAGKTITKFWNVARFISTFKMDGDKYELREIDKWIISEALKLVNEAKDGFDKYDFHSPSLKIRHFIWDTLSSHYLEIAKRRVYDSLEFTKEEKNGAVYTLNYVLDILLKILAPITPIITYEIYDKLYNKNIHKQEFPKTQSLDSLYTKEDLEEINSYIWKYKKDNNLSLKDSIESMTITSKYAPIEMDLKLMHNISKIEYGENLKI